MTINKHTKISALLRQDPQVLDTLVSINSKFEKLRNPLLRRLMAGRTSLSQAAQIGGCDVKEIAEALEPLGFVFVGNDKKGEIETRASAFLPSFVKDLEKLPVKTLDVRQDLAEGKDPLKKIMAVIKELPADHVLKLINTFEPMPLINLLEKKGYESYLKEISPEEIHAFFKLKAETKEDELNVDMPDTVTEKVFISKLNEFEEKVSSVDVSNMEMPMPMVTILEALSDLPEGFVLSVQHKRIPIFLFNELKERNFDYLLYQAGEHDVKLLIYHKK